MEPITLSSKEGIWTRVNRNHTEEKSVIDYILMEKEYMHIVQDVKVDEKGIYRLKNTRAHSDHNTILVSITYHPVNKYGKIKRWKLNNKQGWIEYNKVIQREGKKLPKPNHKQFQDMIINTMERTVGQITITTGPRKRKISKRTKELKEKNKEARRDFENMPNEQFRRKGRLLNTYYETQNALKTQMEKEDQEEIINKLKQITREGGTKSNLFWKTRRKIMGKPKEEYDTITEENMCIKDPDETKEYRAKYFEELYQAREGRPEFKESTEKLVQAVKDIEQEMKQKPTPPQIKMDEMKRAKKSLKRGKSTGPDNIPNEAIIEANNETLNIYKDYLNMIIKDNDIPPSWQEGEIITIYKGKGTKGKCSNERGITLGSNMGKFLERIINERAKEEITISEAQAGGQRGANTVDHILTMKELIKMGKKKVYIVYLDVTKAYDKAWADAIMYVMHKQGLKSKLWLTIKSMNENLTARINTKYGLTRKIKIKDSITQGGVLSVIEYALMMDEISKNIAVENLGIKISEDQNVGCLLWMDDVILITDKEEEMQKMLDITYKTMQPYHIEFGQSKSMAQMIGKVERIPFTLGDTLLKYTDKYKYLGHIQNSKNNLADHLIEMKSKAEAAYQMIIAIAGNRNFKGIELDAIWEMTKSCIVSIITYSLEACNPTKAEMKSINRIMENIITRILMVPPTTPKEILYIETGLLDMESTIEKNRINYANRVANTKKNILGKITKSTNKGSWKVVTDKISDDLGITEKDKEGKHHTTKRNTKIKVEKKFQEKLKEAGNKKSKVKFFLNNKGEWQTGKRAEYMDKLNRMDASMIFKARSRMLEVKNNYKKKYRNHMCRLCNNKEEDQTHVLQECPALEKFNLKKATLENIFSEDIRTLKETSTCINRIMAIVQNI